MLTILTSLIVACCFELLIVAGETDCSKKPSKDSIFSCCHRQVLLNQYGPKCEKNVEEESEHASPLSLCTAYCIFRENNLTVNEEIPLEEASYIFQDLYSITPEVIPIMEQALEKCNRTVDQKLHILADVSLDEDDCEPIPALIAHCTLTEAFINCPKERWENSKVCKEARDYLLSCKQFPIESNV